MTVSGLASLVLSFATFALAARLSAQEPLWANERVPEQPPARNAVPAKHDPALPTDNGHDSPMQAELRTLARISDDQTYQDTGDPVMPTIGLVSHRAVDLFIKGRGLDFSFERRYSSKATDMDVPVTDLPLGFGWDHCYHARLQVANGGAQVTVLNGNDREDVYTWSAPNSPVFNRKAKESA
jgi:hypothetical protein